MATEHKKYTFYRVTSMGMSTWTIWFSGSIIYYAHAMVEGGAQQVHEEQVELNQSGRNMQQQIDLQMASRLSKMLDKGYKPTRDEALLWVGTGQLGLPLPMKAHPVQKVSVPEFSKAWVQRKYNGHRCMITRDQGSIIAYSIKGKLITTIEHILVPLAETLPEGVVLDGELYVHGKSLQAISSLIKRKQADSSLLRFHAYDVMNPTGYGLRLQVLRSIVDPVADVQIAVVPTYEITDLSEAYRFTELFRAEGYEGAMLRLDNRPYEGGLKRSTQILKFKKWLDDDYEVVDCKPGKNNVAIYVLKLPNGKTFDCLAPGSVPEKQAQMSEWPANKGRMLTVRYAELTEEGRPFHGVAVQFVEEL